MFLTRREVCGLFPVLVATAAAIPTNGAQDDSLPSAVFALKSMPVENSNNAQMRKIIKGKLATGKHIEVHETTLPPNGSPHPPHHHIHSEMWLIREGTVELTINGITYDLGPGGLGFVHSNEGRASDHRLFESGRPSLYSYCFRSYASPKIVLTTRGGAGGVIEFSHARRTRRFNRAPGETGRANSCREGTTLT